MSLRFDNESAARANRAVSAAGAHSAKKTKPVSRKPKKRRQRKAARPSLVKATARKPRGACSIIWDICCATTRAVCGWCAPRPHRLRYTVLAATGVLAVLVATGIARGEIDLSKLLGRQTQTGTPLLTVANGQLTNAGNAEANHVEVTRPRYRLLGTIAPGQSFEIPANDFAIQYEWNENDRTKRETKNFRVAGEEHINSGNARSVQSPSASQTGTDVLEGAVPEGLDAAYDPATHILTVTAPRPMEIRVDGFLLRPVARSEKDGTAYRYVEAGLLVLGQDLKAGSTTTFEVVFTRPQDFYSIPIYVREPGKTPVYLTLSVGTRS